MPQDHTFAGHEGQDTILVRGSMHHVAMTETEFHDWLDREACTRGKWLTGARDMPTTCVVRRSDRSVRCIAAKLAASLFAVQS